jgi:hypothetical protein
MTSELDRAFVFRQSRGPERLGTYTRYLYGPMDSNLAAWRFGKGSHGSEPSRETEGGGIHGGCGASANGDTAMNVIERY